MELISFQSLFVVAAVLWIGRALFLAGKQAGIEFERKDREERRERIRRGEKP